MIKKLWNLLKATPEESPEEEGRRECISHPGECDGRD